MTCSQDGCESPRSYFFVEGQPFCRAHGFGDVQCSGRFASGRACEYRARTCRDGVHMCLRHGAASTCSICLDECGDAGATTTECAHRFHTACLKSWRKQPGGHTCPVCRSTIGISRDVMRYAMCIGLLGPEQLENFLRVH